MSTFFIRVCSWSHQGECHHDTCGTVTVKRGPTLHMIVI